MGDDQFKYIILLLVERGIEAGEVARNDKDNLFEQGRCEPYFEVLDTIKSRLEVYGADLKEYGLDIDLDAAPF